MINIEFHGSAKSKYDLQVRAYASQYKGCDISLYTFESSLKGDIAKIPRSNIAVASTNYRIKHVDEFTLAHRLEIWNEVIPGKERLIATVTL